MPTGALVTFAALGRAVRVLYRPPQKNPQTEWSGDVVEHCPQHSNFLGGHFNSSRGHSFDFNIHERTTGLFGKDLNCAKIPDIMFCEFIRLGFKSDGLSRKKSAKRVKV